MIFQLKWNAIQIAYDFVWRLISLPTLIWLKVLISLYQFLHLGPQWFQEGWLKGRITSYQVLEFIWSHEMWPWLKWLPLAVLVDVVLKQIFKEPIILGSEGQT